MNKPMTLLHDVSGHGKGKWHSRRTLWTYKLRRKAANQRASAARRRNR